LVPEGLFMKTLVNSYFIYSGFECRKVVLGRVLKLLLPILATTFLFRIHYSS